MARQPDDNKETVLSWLIQGGYINVWMKRKCTQWWSIILPISTKQKKVYTVMVNNSTNINKTKESVNSDGQ